MKRRGRPPKLTDEQRAYLRGIAEARIRYRQLPGIKRLAHEMHLSPRTIEAYMTKLVEELLRDNRSNETSQVTTMV